MALINFTDLQKELDNAVNHFSGELKKLRAGRPRIETFTDLSVMMYGAATPIKSVANVSIEGGTSVIIKPYFADKDLMNDISRVVTELNLGFNPSIQGDIVRVNIPPMTEERRLQTIKEMKAMQENALTTVRVARQKFNDKVDAFTGVSEDDQKRDKNDIQKAVDLVNKQIKDMAEAKEEDLKTL